MSLFAIFLGLSSHTGHVEDERAVWHHPLSLVWIDLDPSLAQELLVEVESHWDLANIREAEGFLSTST